MRIALILLVSRLSAQVVLTPNLPASVNAGATFQMTVTQTGSDNIAGYQFNVALPAGVSLTSCASLVASKSVACPPIPAGGLTGNVIVLLTAMNQSAIPSTPSLSLTFKAASPMSANLGVFSLTKTVATTPQAQTVGSVGGSATVRFINPSAPQAPCTLVSSTKLADGSFTTLIRCK